MHTKSQILGYLITGVNYYCIGKGWKSRIDRQGDTFCVTRTWIEIHETDSVCEVEIHLSLDYDDNYYWKAYCHYRLITENVYALEKQKYDDFIIGLRLECNRVFAKEVKPRLDILNNQPRLTIQGENQTPISKIPNLELEFEELEEPEYIADEDNKAQVGAGRLKSQQSKIHGLQ